MKINLIRTFLYLLIAGLLVACSTLKKPYSPIIEDELIITRKYVGTFLEYRYTGPDTYSGYNIVWIKTSMDSTYGKISVYGKKCEFSAGDRLFLRRTYFSPGGISGYWIYKIENDSALSYKATEFQHDRKVFIQTWF
jgi:hypothetical protein